MEHPITPPPELVQQWDKEAAIAAMPDQIYIATQAARWGADQELEACCGWIEGKSELGVLSFIPEVRAKFRCQVSDQLRAARRLKPPSLKQQALEALDSASYQPGSDFKQIDPARSTVIRRALESLPNPQDSLTNHMAERITRAPQARKFIGKEVRWWPLREHSGWAQVDILHEVAGRNVRIGFDWRWLPDIYMAPAEDQATTPQD